MKKNLLLILSAFFIIGLTVLAYLYSPWWPFSDTQIDERETVRDIPVLEGFERVEKSPFATYLLNLPLAEDGLPIQIYGAESKDSIQQWNFRLIDKPILSLSEQCADVCMHLRADYLFANRRFFDIHFEDTQSHTHRYWLGNMPERLNNYLRRVYEVANTESLIHEMPSRFLTNIQPGDVFVYDYKSRPDKKYGHAMMVLSVAVHPATGQKAIMLVQGSTPVCSIHILRNPDTGTPWFMIDENAESLDFGFAKYKRNELHYFK